MNTIHRLITVFLRADTKILVILLAFIASIATTACPPESPVSQPLPSVAQLEVLRGPVSVRGKKEQKKEKERVPVADSRLEPGAVVYTGKTGRAILKLDLGATILMDRSGEVRISPKGIELIKGRIFVDTVSQIEVLTPVGKLRSLKSNFDVETRGKAVRVYCASGEVSYPEKPHDKKSKDKDKQKGKSISSGMTVVLQRSGAELLPEALWEDWTSGMARVGPKRERKPAGIGRLEGRLSSAFGRTPTPLLTRRHEVNVAIKGDMAVTTINQTFFNPHSHNVSGYYEVLLPEGAIISEFAAGPSDEMGKGEIVSRYRKETKYNPNVLLEWAGDNLYKGHMNNIARGSTYGVKLVYIQWLKHQDGRRVYVYPMGGGHSPRLGEFVLEVDLAKTEADKTQASLGAQRRGSKILLSKSDYRPPADFVLELLDSKKKTASAKIYRAAGQKKGQPSTLYMVIPPPLPEPPKSLKLVVVADLSAGLSPTQVKLVRDTVDSVLQQLSSTDKVAVLAADLDVRNLGKEEGLAVATKEYRESIIDSLARHRVGGASDIGGALEKAALMLPEGEGAVLYIGDGRPSAGLLMPGAIKDRLARRKVFPRLFAIAVGSNADRNFLEAVIGPGGLCEKIENRPQAARAVFGILSESSRPSLRAVKVHTGGKLERVYPSRPFTVTGGEQIRISAQTRGAIPKKLVVEALANGKPVKVDFQTQSYAVVDRGDLQRRWATARIRNLLESGAGREAIADLATRYGIMTPWSAMAIGSYQGYTSLLPNPAPKSFSVEDVQHTKGVRTTDIRMSLKPNWLVRRTPTKPSWERLYREAMRSKEAPVRLCFEKKAAGRPEMSGRVDLKIELRADGSVKKVEKVYTSLRDEEVEACMLRAVGALKLPAPPPGAPAEFTHKFQFESPGARMGGTSKCSKASRQYLSRRRTLWRERLARARGLGGVMNVWREAYRQCELRTWLDRRAMLDLMLNALGTVRNGVRLYHAFHFDPSLQSYIRRAVLRRIRTRDDVEAARDGLNLEGLVDWDLLKKGMEKTKTTEEKIQLIKSFLALAPESLRLRTMLLNLLEKAERYSEAGELAYELRRNPASDMGVQRMVGEYLLRRGEKAEARRAFSEIVETAPFDPWARKYLGHIYFANGWCRDAYQQYKTLAWLMPHDRKVDTMLAQASACTGSFDEALRLLAGVSETAEAGPGRSGPAAVARVLTSNLLAKLKAEAAKKDDAAGLKLLKGRSRRLGVLTWAGEMLLTVTWKNRQAPLSVTIIEPGEEEEKPFPLISTDAGLVAMRRKRMNPEKYIITLRPAIKIPNRQASYKGKIVLLLNEAEEKEALIEKSFTFTPEKDALAFEIKGQEITEVEPKKKTPEKKEDEEIYP